MDIRLLFFYLDPFQIILLVTSIVALVLCARSFVKTNSKRFRLMMGLLVGFNFWVILRYILLLIFKMDTYILSVNEAEIINLISQMTQIYIAGIAIYASNSILREEKKAVEK